MIAECVMAGRRANFEVSGLRLVMSGLILDSSALLELSRTSANSFSLHENSIPLGNWGKLTGKLESLKEWSKAFRKTGIPAGNLDCLQETLKALGKIDKLQGNGFSLQLSVKGG